VRWPDALTPLHDRRFAWYFSGRVVSTIGSVMAPVALAFAVLDLTGSASALGVVVAARTVPQVLFLLVGGAVADRFSRSVVMQVSHILSALTQGLVAVLLLTGTASLWMVIVLEALNGIVSAFTFPAFQGIVPQVVPRSHLQQANVLLGFSRNGLAVLGPTIGALVVVTAGSGWAIAVDALTWAVAAACMSRVRVTGSAGRRSADDTSMWRDIVEGWSAFTSMTWVWVVVAAASLLNAIQAGALNTLGPVVAQRTIGRARWGWVLSAEAAGLLLMTFGLMWWRLRNPLRTGMLGVALMASPILVLGLDPSVLPLVVLGFLAGCGIEVFSIGWQTALQEHVPEHLLSRVSSYDALGSLVAVPVGAVVFGPLADRFGTERVLVVSGVVYLIVAVSTLLSRSVRDLGHAEALQT
jgi:Transmembrane secretion effector